MQINIPLTVLKNDASEAAYTVKRVHVPRMYEDGLKQLEDVCSGNILISPTQNQHRLVSQLRWAGSERYLYKLVAKLGERIGKTSHETFRNAYESENLHGTERVPIWVGVQQVFDRHKNELAYIDNLDRLYNRWCSSNNENVVSIKNSGTWDDPDAFQLICRNVDEGFDLSKFHLNMLAIHTILDTYNLYTTSNRTFFYGNRYRHLTSCVLGDMDRAYVQCTIPRTSLARFLIERGPRRAP